MLDPNSHPSSSPSTPSPVVGYIIGVPSTKAFVSAIKEQYIPSLDDPFLSPPKDGEVSNGDGPQVGALKRFLYRPEDHYLHEEFPRLLKGWPAHLHIDILPEWQGKGWGKVLMEEFCKRLRGEGAKGVHLIMGGGNKTAERFYRKVGFERFGEVLDGGESGEVGRSKDKTVWMVRSL